MPEIPNASTGYTLWPLATISTDVIAVNLIANKIHVSTHLSSAALQSQPHTGWPFKPYQGELCLTAYLDSAPVFRAGCNQEHKH